jgi:hypothetical protein
LESWITEIDDRTAALLLHHRQDVLAAEEHAFQIVVDLRVPDLLRHLDRPARGRTADVVHENVDAAVDLEARLNHRSPGRILGHVALVRLDCAAGLADTLQRLLHRLAVLVGSEDLGALTRKQHRHRAPVAPAGTDATRTGDESHLVLKSTG